MLKSDTTEVYLQYDPNISWYNAQKAIMQELQLE